MQEIDDQFVVTSVDDSTAVLKAVGSGGVFTLTSHPDLEPQEVVVGTVTPEPPLEVSWQLESVEERYSIDFARSPESPTTHARELAADWPTEDVLREERAGTGEIHVLTISPERTEQAVDDVLEDEATLVRAAKLGVKRVEVRSESGLVCVRYLP